MFSRASKGLAQNLLKSSFSRRSHFLLVTFKIPLEASSPPHTCSHPAPSWRPWPQYRMSPLPSACPLPPSWRNQGIFAMQFPCSGRQALRDTQLSSPTPACPTWQCSLLPRPHLHTVNLVQGVFVAPRKVLHVVHGRQGCLLCVWVITGRFLITCNRVKGSSGSYRAGARQRAEGRISWWLQRGPGVSAGRQLEASGPTQVLCLVECWGFIYMLSLRKDCVRIWDDFCSGSKSPCKHQSWKANRLWYCWPLGRSAKVNAALGASVGRLGWLGRCSRVGLNMVTAAKREAVLRGQGEHQGDEGWHSLPWSYCDSGSRESALHWELRATWGPCWEK